MSTAGSRAQLAQATRQLLGRWDEAHRSWRDLKAAEFEERYLSEVKETVGAAIRTLEELDQLLEKVHADCE
ncbi:MAG TPA: hypothetical protein VLO11_09505 [Luteolibacter sp.]|nr:hypothetical protein [Luteolibacter sp.]